MVADSKAHPVFPFTKLSNVNYKSKDPTIIG
jgi:hypothetical protein